MELHLPAGFLFSGVSCSIKKRPGSRDLTLIVTQEPATAAAVYTQNQVVAAPVTLCRTRTPSTKIRGVVVNSGCANACTGTRGAQDAITMTQLAAQYVSQAIGGDEISGEAFLVMSTGVIGRYLPLDKIENGIRDASARLDSAAESFLNAADGILTTDQGRKVASRTWEMDGNRYHLAGMCKGAGMIGPNLATMLSVLLTDANLDPEDAQRILKNAADRSFNCISVEGHTSTNDTVALLASGKAGDGKPLKGAALDKFEAELIALCIDVAIQIPDDGEGATHLIDISITGAVDDPSARRIAAVVASSNLVKTAITGGDPNWGRIVSAAGYAGEPIEPGAMRLTINDHLLFEGGEPIAFQAAEVSQSIKASKLTKVNLTVGTGPGTGRHWTSDLNCEYVKFNSEYTT